MRHPAVIAAVMGRSMDSRRTTPLSRPRRDPCRVRPVVVAWRLGLPITGDESGVQGVLMSVIHARWPPTSGRPVAECTPSAG